MEKSPYTFNTLPNGNVEVLQNGQRISTGTASSAERYGYSDYIKSVKNPNNQTIGTGQFGNPLGITSSSDISKANAAKTATSSAAGAISGTQPQGETTPVVPMTELEKERLQLDKDRLAFEQGVTTRAEKALSLSYNAGLAKINNQYKDLKDELDEQYKTDIDYALEAVTAANPYGAVVGGDQSLKNYKDKITQKYNAQALKIESKMSEAQLALEAENYEGYAKIVESVQKSKLDFSKEMFQFKLDLNKQMEQKAQFNTTIQTKYSDDYRSYLTSVPYSPDEISKMTDEQIMNTTAGRLGAKAGLTAEMIRRDMSEGSYASQRIKQAATSEANRQAERDRQFSLAMMKFAESAGAGKNVTFDVGAEGLSGSFNRAFSEATTQGYSEGEVERIVANAKSYAASGDYEGLKENLLNVATKSLGTAEQTRIRGRQAAIDALTNIETALEDYKKKNPTGTNIVSGTLEQIVQKVGASSDPDLARIKNLIQLAMSDYRLGQTGVAFNKEEAKQYKDIYPDISNLGGLNTSKISATKEAMQIYVTSTLGSIIGQKNYEEIYGQPTTNTGGSNTITSNGQTYTIGQVYEDGTGAKWTIDSNGVWSLTK